MSQSTPIENLTGRGDEDIDDNENLSTAQQVLEKYNQMEQEPDADTERAQVNQDMEQRQLDQAMINQHRMMEMQRAREYQLQQQQQQQPPPPPPPQKKSFMDKIKTSLSNIGKQLKGTVIVVILFLVLSLPMVNKMMLNVIPKISSDEGLMNMKGLLLKSLLAGVLFYVLNTFIPL